MVHQLLLLVQGENAYKKTTGFDKIDDPKSK